MSTINRTTLCIIVYACINLMSLSAMVISPEKITIHQANNENYTPGSVIKNHKNKFPIPYLFSRLKNNHSQIDLNPICGSQKRQVQVHISHLKYASKINLNLFPDLQKIARLQRIEHRFSDDFTWFGSVDSSNEINAILTVKGTSLYGNVTIDNQVYQISPKSPPLHEIALMDYSNYPAEHPPVSPQSTGEKDHLSGNQQGDDGSAIDIMVVYTQQAANEAGNIDALIRLAIDETNLSYEKSNIQTRLHLVHVHPLDYNEQDMISDLKNLAHDHDGYMDEIHALRDQYFADIVVMIEFSNAYCGVSFLNPNADFAFCIVSAQCATGYYSFGHEIGHLFGARHNPEADPLDEPYPYGHGYLHVNGWRTIMAYNNYFLCPNGFCRRILHWSNPLVRYRNIYTGTFSKHNNSRVLNEAALKLANFRTFGGRFTIYNNDDHPVDIHSIVPSNDWLKMDPNLICPFQLNGLQHKSFKIDVDWNQLGATTKGQIKINQNHSIQIMAIPSMSLTDMAITPNQITCNKDISIQDIHISGAQNLQWRAFSNSPWVTIIDGYKGIGNGTVMLRVDKNHMEMREGSVGITAMNLHHPKIVKVCQTGNHLEIDMPLKVRENDQTLTRAGKLSIPLKSTRQIQVKLSVSDESALDIPEYITIPEQEKSVHFDIHIKDNSISDGLRIVSVIADSPGWFSGKATVNILDDESGGIIYVGEGQAYETIQPAIEDAASESSILVLPGTYLENIHLTKPVHLCAANGPAHTIIQGNQHQRHTINITSNHVIIEGFTIIGAENYGLAGIYLSPEANHCMVTNNICGQDHQHFNYYGIYVDTGGFHTLSNNLCQHNKRFGIFLDQSIHNTLVNNTCQLNQRTGMKLTQSKNNVIYKNILKYQPKYGLNLSYNSNHNTIYLNSFINNDDGNVNSQWSRNIWHQPTPVNHSFGHGFLGNFFDDHSLDDLNDDGITDTIYELPNNEIQEYPLSNHPEHYESQTQLLGSQNQFISDEMPTVQSKCLCASGQTTLFQSSPERHGLLEWTAKDAHTGNLRFVSPIQRNHRLLLQFGKVDSEGVFKKAGQGYEIIGDGEKVNFRFCIFSGDFLIEPNENSAFQITNESPLDYSIWIGGGHTYISSYKHEQTDQFAWTVGKDATFRSIQTALSILSDFQSSMTKTVTVLPGVYTENIKIEKPVALISKQGYTQTVIAARRSDHHVIHIHSDHVRIEGFSIYGANRNHSSGLCIDRGVANCYIANNRLGFDPSHTNDYGLIIQSSIQNTIVQNQCISNEKHGIWLNNAFMNHLAHNTCFQNHGAGIYLSDALLNTFIHNVCENNGDDGIHLVKSSRNHLQFNIFATNENNGLTIDADSFVNLIYLNNFVLNQHNNVFSHGMNQWFSDTQINYQFSGHIFTSVMGNYYGNHIGQDIDNNGLIDAPYTHHGLDQADPYALIRPFSFYDFIPIDTSVQLAVNQASDITKTIIAARKPEMKQEKSKPSIPITETTHPEAVDHEQTQNFFKVEIQTDPVKPAKPIQPIILFTEVPDFGNRLKNLKGLVLNVNPELHHIGVYIHIKDLGWRSKPYPAAPMTPITSDGRWECDITTSAFDQNADIIVAVLYVSDRMPPTLINAPVLPDTVYEQGIGFVRNER